VTEGGRIFLSLAGFSEPDKKRTHGLYELEAKTGTSVATLIPVEGTVTAYDANDIPPDGTFYQLWGSDGNELVVRRQGDGRGLSHQYLQRLPGVATIVITRGGATC
jgi:hypothetical protein